jgi:hypothetical protein
MESSLIQSIHIQLVDLESSFGNLITGWMDISCEISRYLERQTIQ